MKYKTKILLAIFLVSIVLLAIGAWRIIGLSRDILYDRTLTKTDTIGKILVDDAQRDFSEGIFTHIQGVLKTTDDQPNIDFAFIVDRNNNKVIYSSREQYIDKPDPYRDSGDIRNTEGNEYIVSFPIQYKKNNFLYVQLGYSLSELKDDLENIEDIAEYVNSGMVLFILLVSWFISSRLLAPLTKMKSVADEIAKGNFSPRLAVNSKDVIGDLALSLNNMAGQLDGLTNNLNRKIADATAELRKVNEELSRKTAELENSNKKLKELDKLKTEFVSTVSHELRTPLTAMIGFSNTILNLKLTEEQKEKYLRIIESEGKRLARLIEDFLDISKIELGIIASKMTVLNIADLINETIERVKLPPEIRIEINLSSGPLNVMADRDKMKQVILNIVDNAVKYSSPGGRITISAGRQGGDVAVSIKDEGPGIKNDELEKIFDKFYRSKDSVTQRSRGSGLGLAIVKGIIEMHHGKIWAQSEPGMGATFYFTLPFREAQDVKKDTDYRG